MIDRVVSARLTEGKLCLLRASRSGGPVRIEAVEALDLPADAESTATARKALGERGFLGLPTVLVLSSRRAFVCLHHPSVQERKALQQTIRYEVEKEMPMPVEGMALDFDYVGNGLNGSARVLIGAVSGEELRSQLEALRPLGLSPTQATLTGAAVGNAYNALGLTNGSGRTLGLHFGDGSVDVIRLKDGAIEEMRAVPAEEGSHGNGSGLPALVRSSVVEAGIWGDLDAACVSGPPEKAEAASVEVVRELGMPVLKPDWDGLDLSGLPEGDAALLKDKGLPLFGAAAEALGAGPATSLNLLDPARQASQWLSFLRRPLRAASLAFVILLALWSAVGVVRLYEAGHGQREAASELSALWTKLHPGARLPVDPGRSLKSELSAYVAYVTPAEGSRLPMLESLLSLTKPISSTAGGLPYQKIRTNREGVLVEGSLPDYVAVDALLKRLKEEGGFEPASPEMTSRSGAVSFVIQLRRAK